MGNDDWSELNFFVLVGTLGTGIGLFLLAFVASALDTRRRSMRSSSDPWKTLETPALRLVKLHTRIVRTLATAALLLELPLLAKVTAISATAKPSYSLRIVRPTANICGSILGFMTNTHAAFRVLFLLALTQSVALDTVAEVSFTMSIACLELQGLQCGDGATASLSAGELQLLKLRELASLVVNVWLMLEVSFLCVSIGWCSSRYSARQLSLSRPVFNLRAAMAAHLPRHRSH